MTSSLLRTAALLIACALPLGACTASPEDGLQSTHAADNTITHVFGNTVIPEKVERVAVIGWNSAETALALGIVPVAMVEAAWGTEDDSKMFPWVRDKVKELGGEQPVLHNPFDGINYEAIASSKPDIILATYSGITAEDYEKLSKIAPTVAYPKVEWATPWREQFLMDTAAMNKKAEGAELLKSIDQKIDDVKKAHPEFSNYTAAFVSVEAVAENKFGYLTTVDPRAAFLYELGFKKSDALEKHSSNAEAFYHDFSLENVDIFNDVDIMVSNGSPEALEAARTNPLSSKIPAISRNSVVMRGAFEEPLSSLTIPNAMTIPLMLDDYAAELAEATTKVKK